MWVGGRAGQREDGQFQSRKYFTKNCNRLHDEGAHINQALDSAEFCRRCLQTSSFETTNDNASEEHRYYII